MSIYQLLETALAGGLYGFRPEPGGSFFFAKWFVLMVSGGALSMRLKRRRWFCVPPSSLLRLWGKEDQKSETWLQN